MEKDKKEKTNELEKKVSTLTMCVVVMGVLLLSLGGYLLYDKVGNKSNAEGSSIKIPTSSGSDHQFQYCGLTGNTSSTNSIVRIIRNDVIARDANNQNIVLNKGDELYDCYSTADDITCKSYIRLNTDKFIDGTFVVDYNNCKNFVYLR